MSERAEKIALFCILVCGAVIAALLGTRARTAMTQVVGRHEAEQAKDPNSPPSPVLPGEALSSASPKERFQGGGIDSFASPEDQRSQADDLLYTTPLGMIVPWDEIDDGMQNTAQGLYALTAEQWKDENFALLTCPEVDDMLHGVAGYDLSGHQSFVERFGLPTIEDCEHAMDDDRVRELLGSVCSQTVLLAILEATPNDTRTVNHADALEQMRHICATSELQLMQELDSLGGYQHWTILHKAWKEWTSP